MEFLIQKDLSRASRDEFRQFSTYRERGWSFFFFFLFLGMFFCCTFSVARAQTISHEYPLKTVFLYNFAQFTGWPTNAFDRPDSPLVIGVLGDDPFGALLDAAVRDETVSGRKFVVARFHRVEDIKTCHILFISQSESRHLDEIVSVLENRPVLTVSDVENPAYHDVCVRLITEKNKIRLRINMNSLQKANLTMSSKLLRVAEIIPPTK